MIIPEPVLIVRETLVKAYKRVEVPILMLAKFLLGMLVYSEILSINHVNAKLLEFTADIPLMPVTVILALVFALMPYTLSWMLMILLIAFQYSAFTEVAVLVLLGLLMILLFYARMAVKESALVVLTVLAFHWKVPYLVPLLVGLYGGLTAVLPVAVGVFVYAFVPVVNALTASVQTAGLEITELPLTMIEAFVAAQVSLMTAHSWIFIAFIFAMVIVVVHVVSRLSIDYAKELAVVLGMVLNIFGFMLAVAVAGEPFQMGGVVLGTVLCGLLAGGIRFFDSVLDYQRAESVQFEDDRNYYYVRVVPKVLLTRSSGSDESARVKRQAAIGGVLSRRASARETGRDALYAERDRRDLPEYENYEPPERDAYDDGYGRDKTERGVGLGEDARAASRRLPGYRRSRED